ncbi:MAG: hypothetical protein HKM94_04060 [Halobacteria archaeon]|nr:hypothetical protein [Halobacteria archaeon]
MNTTDEKPRMQRITITLDAFETSSRELERAARLAARLGAELEGIFVEDLDLIQLAGLPFLREVRSASLAVEALNLGRLEQELRVLARRAERTLAEHANRHGAAWSFRVWRGSIERDLLAATLDADVLAMARLGAMLAPRSAAHADRPGIAVLFSGSEAAMRALTTATDLAADPEIPLNVLLPGKDEIVTEQLRKQAEALLGEQAQTTHFMRLFNVGLPDLVQALADSNSAILVLEREHEFLQTSSLRHCLTTLACTLLVVR